MRFRAQLVAGFASVLVVTLAVGTTSMIAVGTVASRLERVGDDLAVNLLAIERLHYEAEQVVSTSRAHLLAGDERGLTRFDDAVGRFHRQLAGVSALDDALPVDEAATAYITTAREAAQRRSQHDDPRAILPFFENSVTPAQQRFERAIGELESLQRDRFRSATTAAHDFAAETQLLVAAGITLAALLGILLAYTSARRLGRIYAREEQATAAARQAIAERDELLAVVSHDLRSPLSTIVLGSALIVESVADPTVHKHVTAIGNAGHHMQSLIGELLEAAQFERGCFEPKREPCPVRELVDTIASLFGARASDAGIELACDAREELVVVADRERVIQILSNLVGNALKYTPAGGRISVAARADSDRVRFDVTDTGPGLTDEQRAHVFDRYWQHRPRGHGSLGLGLYICKRLVEAHGCEIRVDSEPGRGATFWFTLRAARPAAAA